MGSVGRNVSNPMRKVARATTRGLGSSGQPPPMAGGMYQAPQNNALFFRDGQAYGRSPMQAHGLSRATNPKKGVSPSPMNYKPLGFTAQEAGYFGPGRYGAAKRYGEDSVTNPNVPFQGNYYPGGTSVSEQAMQSIQQESLQKAKAEADKRVRAVNQSVPMSTMF
jgi:hypothetical protein